jgi:L-malate glycosyltransferase
MAKRSPSVQRVLLVVPTTQFGGMETHCIDLAAEYARRGLEVAAMIPKTGDLGPLKTRFQAAGARVQCFDMDARRGRLAQSRDWPKLVSGMQSWHPDVVHVHNGGPSGGVSLIAAARCAESATVILTEHNPPPESVPLRQRVLRPLMDRWSHALVAVSRRNARLRAERMGAAPEKFAVVQNGVPVRAAAPAESSDNRRSIRTRYGIDEAAMVIGGVVRLVEGKGLHDLVRAFAVVAGQIPADLLLVGDGPLRQDLELLGVTLNISEHVHFVGQHDDPYPFLDAMDLFALAVPDGSMSIALLEAMGRGVPPVITFWGPEEAVIDNETGLAAPPNDPDGLAQVLLRAARDGALRGRLAAAATAHVARHFSVSRVADDLLELYEAAGAGTIPERLRFDAPPNPRPGKPT